MKLITFVVPCYNSAEYMEKCLDSILCAREDIEVIIVNDGSTDQTAAIADRYASRYPGVVSAIHQPNGGYGAGVAQGLSRATGAFFKLVDSDDWLEPAALAKVLARLRALLEAQTLPDLFLCNYTRSKPSADRSRVIRYKGTLPEGSLFTWADIGRLPYRQALMIHAFIFNTALLRQLDMELPLHTFYIDCLIVHLPLYRARSLYYMDVSMYQYIIGRKGQTIEIASIIQNVSHMRHVFDLMVKGYEARQGRLEGSQRLVIRDDLRMRICTVSAYLALAKTPEATEENLRMWQGIKERDPELYRMLRYNFHGFICGMNRPWARAFVRQFLHWVDAFFLLH